MIQRINKPLATIMDQTINYDSPTNERTARAFEVLRQLTDWFATWHPEATCTPNLRISRTLLALCVGERAVWNSEEDTLEQLCLVWVLNEWVRGLMDDLKPIMEWRNIAYTPFPKGYET